MSEKRQKFPGFLFLGGLLIFSLLLAACASPGSASGQSSALPGGSGSTTANHTQTGSGVPSSATQQQPVSTSCPATGTARAAVIQPMTLGSHKNIVYIVNQGGTTHPTLGTLKRYDVTTGNKTEILNLSKTYISDAVLSADGQWILFVAIASNQPKLQLVRMDGTMLQTLYCAQVAPNGAAATSALSNVEWSTNQKLIIFNSYNSAGNQVLLLNAQTGNLQTELTVSNGGPYPVATWLDSTRVYLLGQSIDAPADSLYLLDTSKGSNQSVHSLTRVFQNVPVNGNYACWGFDSSYDGSRLYASECTEKPNSTRPGVGAIAGPSQLVAQPATGGRSGTIYSNASVAITSVRAVTSNTLLLLFENQSFSSTSVDTSQNGLWKINSDGTGLKRLTSDGGGVGAGPSILCQYSQYPWSNVSRDSGMYALQHNSSDGKTVSLLFGSLNGGSTTTFASISDGTQLSIIGWTTM